MTHPLELTGDALSQALSLCTALVQEHLDTLPQQHAGDLRGAEALADSFIEPLPEVARPLPELLSRLRPAIQRSFNTAGPGYLAFIPGGGLPAAALADLIATATNRYVGVRAAAPALAQIEETAVAWLAQLMGYPAGARGILTSGGSLSNFVALFVARSERLPEDFLRGTLYVSEDTHLSVAKAARLAGFPARNVRAIAVDGERRMQLSALERAIAEDRAAGLSPFFLVGNAGTTNTGAIDPLDQLADAAARHGLWFHVDGAYGGFFRLAPSCAAALAPIARADSVTLDPHKGLFLPYGTGCLLVRDGAALLRAHRTDAAYLRDVASGEEHPNASDLSPELSRDFRGLRVWLPLMLHGLPAFREQLEEKLQLTRLAEAGLREDPRFEVLGRPQTSVVAFRLRSGGSPQEQDDKNRTLLQRINARGRVFLSSTVLEGRFTLRICVLSFRTHQDRIRDAVSALREEAQALCGPATS